MFGRNYCAVRYGGESFGGVKCEARVCVFQGRLRLWVDADDMWK